MKLATFSLSKLLCLLIISIGMAGCADEYEYDDNPTEGVIGLDGMTPVDPGLQSTLTLYTQTQTKVRERFGEMLTKIRQLPVGKISSATGSQVIEYLIGQSEEELERISNQLCTPSDIQAFDEAYEATIDCLTELSSEKEVEQLFDFVRMYSHSGGQSLTTVVSVSSQFQTEVMQECVVVAAAFIDEMMVPLQTNIYGYHAECVQQLKVSMAKDLVSGAIVDYVATVLLTSPEVDLVFELICIGYDLVGAIELTKEYLDCCKNAPIC